MESSHQNVAIIEDEPDILETLRYNLEREGFRVSEAATGPEGLNLVRGLIPDIVLLDLLLPGIDGLEVCRRLRSNGTTRDIPIIMITAKGEERDIIEGLSAGADDYVAKPFSPREVVARVRAVLRRGPVGGPSQENDRLVFGDVVVDGVSHTVTVDGEPVRLTATEFRLLHFLARHPSRVFTRDQLINHVMGDTAVVIDRNIDVHVRAVRRKLGEERQLIATVRGVGYRFQQPESPDGVGR